MIAIVRRRRQWLGAALGILLSAGIMGGLIACESDTASTASARRSVPAAGATQVHARSAPRPPDVQSAALRDRAWWNQSDLVEALSLTPEQRAKMDALLLHSVETQRAAQQQQREQQRALKEALNAGNWDAARRAADGAADGMARAWRTQTTLKVDVLASLDSNQQRLITSQYPQVLRQTSVLTRWRGGARRPAATPVGTP